MLVGSFVLAGSLSAADQQLVNMVMPDARAVAGINVDSARNSPFGTFLLSQMSATDAGFQKFVTASGFNPSTDLQEILVATPATANPAPALKTEPVPSPAPDGVAVPAKKPSAAGMHPNGLIMARGTFNVAKISALAKTDGKQTVETYNDAVLISDPKDASASAMAFVGTNIALAGDLVSVKAALDRRSQTNTIDPQLTVKINSLSASQDAWGVSIAPLSSLGDSAAAGGADPALQGALGGDMFKKISATSGGVKFGTLIQITTELVALDEKNATALGDVLKFLAGMVTMNAGGANGKVPPAIASLLQSLSVSTAGNVVNVNLSLPEDQIEGLVNSMKTPAKKSVGSKI